MEINVFLGSLFLDLKSESFLLISNCIAFLYQPQQKKSIFPLETWKSCLALKHIIYLWEVWETLSAQNPASTYSNFTSRVEMSLVMVKRCWGGKFPGHSVYVLCEMDLWSKCSPGFWVFIVVTIQQQGKIRSRSAILGYMIRWNLTCFYLSNIFMFC